MKEKRLSSVAGLVGNNIAERRKQKHMTQARMGELLGITTDSLCRMERGIIAPRFHRLADIAAILGCSVADLFAAPGEIVVKIPKLEDAGLQADPAAISAEIAKLSRLSYEISNKIAALSRLLPG